MRVVVLACAALLAGCARCGATHARDAGAAARVKRSTDLRSAIMLIFPEYRGAGVTSASATLTRTMSGAKDWRAELAGAMTHNNFTPDADGGAGGARPPFRIGLTRDAPTAELQVNVALDAESVDRVLNAPFSVSTPELGLFFPRREGLVVEREVFELRLAYVAYEARGSFLTRQLVDLLLSNGQWTSRGFPDAGWGPRQGDGGRGPVPERFEVVLDGKADGATIVLHREGQSVELRYTLVTDAPAG